MQYYTASTPIPPYIAYARFLLDFPLGETARIVYSLILSRIQLSQSNGWADDQGHIYCRYPIRSLASDCGKSRTTIVTALAELEKQGLLVRRRGGASRASMLYLRLPENGFSEGRKSDTQKAEKPAPNNRLNQRLNYAYKGDSL